MDYFFGDLMNIKLMSGILLALRLDLLSSQWQAMANVWALWMETSSALLAINTPFGVHTLYTTRNPNGHTIWLAMAS